jgi:hypothetical protein
MKIKTLSLALLATLATGALAYAALTGGHASPAPPREPAGLRVEGHVTGLYPARHKPVWVHVRNPFDRRARVRWIRTRVLDVGPDCSQDNIAPRRSRGLRQLKSGRWRHVKIPPHQTRRVRVRLRMRERAPDGCQGARFPLRFRVKLKVWG